MAGWPWASVAAFFFQAEDGIRDGRVTGVQTCALPIFTARDRGSDLQCIGAATAVIPVGPFTPVDSGPIIRSEERRVGKSVDLGGRRIIQKKTHPSIR